MQAFRCPVVIEHNISMVKLAKLLKLERIRTKIQIINRGSWYVLSRQRVSGGEWKRVGVYARRSPAHGSASSARPRPRCSAHSRCLRVHDWLDVTDGATYPEVVEGSCSESLTGDVL